jgi:hypothetical protein
MKENVQIVNVSHEEWLRLWQSTKEGSFSVDERDNEWIFAEARNQLYYREHRTKWQVCVYQSGSRP